MSIDGKLATYKVHRLVAEFFIENENNKPQVNHINGIKEDNNANNLEWCTNQENVQHAYDNNLIDVVKGEKHHNSKLTIDIVNKMKELRETGLSFKNIAKQFNVSRTTCSRAIQGITWK
jgi:YesN/AraC family two-component response regulator